MNDEEQAAAEARWPKVYVLNEGSPGGVSAEQPGEAPAISPQGQENVGEYDRWRDRLSDVPDDRLMQMIGALRAGGSVRRQAKDLIEEGFCAHLRPNTVRYYVSGLRDSLGIPPIPMSEPAPDPAAPDDDGEPVEAHPLKDRLAWLIRLQQGRVRKALKAEALMSGFLLPMASSEIKLMAELLDREIAIAVRTGEIGPTGPPEPDELRNLPVSSPAEAFRVVLAYKRLLAISEGDPPPVIPAVDAEGR